MKYIIKDADGNITNTINADAEFVEANFEHYELWVAPTPTAEETTLKEVREARTWRDSELARTDIAATVSDYPNAEAILAYRQVLRDWPSTESFPDTRPALGE
jgi:hypothetical protein